MAEKAEQTTTALAKADFVSGSLFGAVTGVALHLAPDLELAPVDGEDEVDLSIRLLGELKARAEAVVGELGAAGEEIATLKRAIAGHKGMGNRLRNQVAALEAEQPRKPRKFKPIESPLQAAQLLELIEDAESVELAFLGEGDRELAAVGPRSIQGDVEAWRVTDYGLRLTVGSLRVRPEELCELHGYALLIDGDCVAIQHRQPVRMTAGSENEFGDDVLFAPEIAEPAPAEA